MNIIELDKDLEKHLNYLGIIGVRTNDYNTKVVGVDFKSDITKTSLTIRDVEMIIRTWNIAKGVYKSTSTS